MIISYIYINFNCMYKEKSTAKENKLLIFDVAIYN